MLNIYFIYDMGIRNTISNCNKKKPMCSRTPRWHTMPGAVYSRKTNPVFIRWGNLQYKFSRYCKNIFNSRNSRNYQYNAARHLIYVQRYSIHHTKHILYVTRYQIINSVTWKLKYKHVYVNRELNTVAKCDNHTTKLVNITKNNHNDFSTLFFVT